MAFTVAVRIPAGHHGYVDRGDEGFYIPFSFSFPGLSESGVESAVVSRPEGVRDDEVKAFVLRGRGEFGLELSPAEKLSGMDEVEASLRYQICNDLTGVCYPPRRLTIEVPLPG